MATDIKIGCGSSLSTEDILRLVLYTNGSGNYALRTVFTGGGGVAGCWILETGFWDDDCFWDDTLFWID